MSGVPRVRLRELQDCDAGAVHRLLSDMRVVRYMLFELHTEEMAREFVRESTMKPRQSDLFESLTRAITFSDSGAVIGLCGLGIDRGREQAELWYLLDPDYWGKGLTTEASAQMLALGFGQLHLHRIYATCLPANPASSHVLKKLGMRREGYLRKALRIQGKWHDAFLYGILREEWHV